eukprot:gene4238-23424_t
MRYGGGMPARGRPPVHRRSRPAAAGAARGGVTPH